MSPETVVNLDRLRQIAGTDIDAGNESYLIVQSRALAWSPAGYRESQNALPDATLLTPPSTLRALTVGYRPVLHGSAIELMG